MAFPLGIFAVVVLGASLVTYARIDHSTSAAADEKPSSTAGDHWHAAYGFYVCDKFLPALQDGPSDPDGIHTHGDGAIHIHPFKGSVSGTNARLKAFGKQVGVEFYDNGWKLPDGTEYRTGSAKCGDKTAKLAVYKWQVEKPSEPVQVFESNFGNIHFDENFDAYTLAVLPDDWPADKVPPKPDSAANLEQLGAADTATDAGTDTTSSDPTGGLGGLTSTVPVEPSSSGVANPTTPAASVP